MNGNRGPTQLMPAAVLGSARPGPHGMPLTPKILDMTNVIVIRGTGT